MKLASQNRFFSKILGANLKTLNYFHVGNTMSTFVPKSNSPSVRKQLATKWNEFGAQIKRKLRALVVAAANDEIDQNTPRGRLLYWFLEICRSTSSSRSKETYPTAYATSAARSTGLGVPSWRCSTGRACYRRANCQFPSSGPWPHPPATAFHGNQSTLGSLVRGVVRPALEREPSHESIAMHLFLHPQHPLPRAPLFLSLPPPLCAAIPAPFIAWQQRQR